MKLNHFILIIYFSFLSLLPAADINFDSVFSQWEDSSGSLLADGNQILIGNFDLLGAFDFSLIGTSNFDTYSEVNSFFTQYGSDITESDFGTSGLSQGGNGTSSDTGSAIYFWVFNDSNLNAASEWAIVGNTSWTVPSDTPLPGSISIDPGVDTGTRSIEFGNLSSNTGLGNELNIQTVLVVPEPSTYALFAGILSIGYIIVRRSRSRA